MKRQLIVAGNWKMFKSLPEAIGLARRIKLKFASEKGVEIVLCPPFPYLVPLSELLRGTPIKLGAQNMHYEDEGAFTGEVSAKMLLTSQVNFVIIGHSERRTYFGETDEIVNLKVKKAIEAGLVPIMCIGETLEERQQERTLEVLERQLNVGLAGVNLKTGQEIVIAYEPVWAIGTGVNATPLEAQESHAFIRSWLKKRYGEGVSSALRIQYGGSLKPENARAIFEMEDVDGGLVGGASLDADAFGAIIIKAKEAKC